MPHQSEAPVRGRTGFSKIGGLLVSVPSVSCLNVRATSFQKSFRSSSDEQERLLRRLRFRSMKGQGFHESKDMINLSFRYLKGPFIIFQWKVYERGIFSAKMVYKRVREAEPPRIKLF